MISLQKVDNAIKFTFTDSQHYLYGNGTIEVPLNSLLLIEDKSDFATFKKPDGDVFISAQYAEFGMSKADLLDWYKNNMVGGGGIPTEEIQEMIDESIAPIKAETVTDAEYISSAHTINLYNISGTVLSSIDATDFIKDGMVSNVEVKDVEISGETVPCLAITFNTDAGHQEIDVPLSEFFDSTQYYTKSETDALLSGKANSSDVYTRTASNYRYMSGASITSGATFDRLYMNKGDGMTNTVAAYFGKINGLPIATKNSSAVNNFTLTEESAFTAFSASTEAALSGKQDTLIAGDSIKIDGNEISGVYYNLNMLYHTQSELDEDVYSDMFIAVDGILGDQFTVPQISLKYIEDEEVLFVLNALYDNGELTVDENTSTENWENYVGIGAKHNYLAIYKNEDSSPFEDVWCNHIEVSGLGASVFTDEEFTISEVLTEINETLSNKISTDAITSSITSASTETEIPSAKAVYDAIGEGGGGLDEDFLQANANALYELKQEGKATNERFDNYYTKTASDGRYASNASIKKAYYDKAYVDDKLLAISASLNELNDDKQDALVAGSGISISGNVISAEGGGGAEYSAGSGIRIYADPTQGKEVMVNYDISDPFYAIFGFDCKAFGNGQCTIKVDGHSYLITSNGDGTFEVMEEDEPTDSYESYFTIEYVGDYVIGVNDPSIGDYSSFFLVTPLQTLDSFIDEDCARFIYQSDVDFDRTSIKAHTFYIDIVDYETPDLQDVDESFCVFKMDGAEIDCPDAYEIVIDVDGEHTYRVQFDYEGGYVVYDNNTGDETSDYETYFSIELHKYYGYFTIYPTQSLDSVADFNGCANLCLERNVKVVDDDTTEVLKTKQDKLYAGSGIDITDNIISVTGGSIDSGAVQSMIDASISGKADSSAVTQEINAAVSGKVDTSAITSSITSASTDTEIPSAKAVYDAIGEGGGGATYSAGTNISIDSANTINCTIPISAGTGNYSIKGNYCSSQGFASVALGNSCTAKGQGGVAIGESCETRVGEYEQGSVAIGYNAMTKGGYGSVAIGFGTNSQSQGEIGCGKYNISTYVSNSNFGNSGNTEFSVGNGASINNRHNALEVRQNGDLYYVDTYDTTTQNYYEKPMLKLQDVIKDLTDRIAALESQLNNN